MESHAHMMLICLHVVLNRLIFAQSKVLAWPLERLKERNCFNWVLCLLLYGHNFSTHVACSRGMFDSSNYKHDNQEVFCAIASLLYICCHYVIIVAVHYLEYYSSIFFVLHEQSMLREYLLEVRDKSICVARASRMARWLRELERKGKNHTIGPSNWIVPSVTKSVDSSGYNYIVTRLSEDCWRLLWQRH